MNSYQEPYDFLAEPLQNAVDVCDLKAGTDKKYIPQIRITLDLDSNEIQICDNGTGFNRDLVDFAVAPFITDKFLWEIAAGTRNPRGHKGVGLTFQAYGFDFFRLSTRGDDFEWSHELRDGIRWAHSAYGEVQRPKFSECKETNEFFNSLDGTGTCVTLRCGGSLPHLATENLAWEFLIRSKTAAGCVDLTNKVDWKDKMDCRFKVIHHGRKGRYQKIPFGYFYPHEFLSDQFKYLDVKDYFDKHPDRGISKEKKGRYHAIYRIWSNDELARAMSGGLKDIEFAEVFEKYSPWVYGLWNWSSRFWDDINEKLGRRGTRAFIKPGIQIAAENMPIGRLIEPAFGYAAGNRERIFILIELTGAKPDLGRKGFSSEIDTLAQKIADKITRYFVDNREFCIPTGKATTPVELEVERTLDERMETIKERAKSNPLTLSKISLQAEPRLEQDVIALFFELIGNRTLLGYKPLSVGSSRDVYDAVVRYELDKNEEGTIHSETHPLGVQKSKFPKRDKIEIPPRFLEFKVSLDDLINEFKIPVESGGKRFKDIFYVVAWEAGEKWEDQYILRSCLVPENLQDRDLQGQTHVLMRKTGGPDKIRVILLKDLRDFLKYPSESIRMQKRKYTI